MQFTSRIYEYRSEVYTFLYHGDEHVVIYAPMDWIIFVTYSVCNL